ncbi:hypothetical protein [Pseudorhodobacter aquimaris]|uniref:hypothetical protein n=1 Tax=Pseudorhodobacter aquimaris TaxID=687412 RepID=UPI00067D3A70|nr:hypothetical protein [Pseudorhodobacter aquimaris]
MKRNEDIEVLSGQLVAQNMMLQMLLGHFTLHGSDRGEELRHGLSAGLGAIKGNPNMTQREKFGCEKTLEEAIDTIDQLRAKKGWTK